MNIILAIIILLIPLSSHAGEQTDIIRIEPIVITASKIEEPLSKTSFSLEVIGREDIEDKQTERIDEALRGVSGVKINSYGGIDPLAWILIRGNDNDHTLVLIDGVEINNPYDYTSRLGSIQTGNIERIEVLKGAHSAIYGSEAIGGVINIITREKEETDAAVKAGNYETVRGSIFYAGKKGEMPYSIGYNRLDSKGSIYTGAFSGNTASGKIKYFLGDNSIIQFNSFYWDHEKRGGELCCELDSNLNYRFTLPDKSINKEYDWINSIQFKKYISERFDYRMQYSRYDFTNIWNLSGDSKFPYPINLDSRNSGSRDTFEIQNNLYLYENNASTIGLQYRGERVSTHEFGNSDSIGTSASKEQPSVNSFRDSRAIYIQNIFNFKERFVFSAGARVEEGLGFGSEVIPRASASYLFPSTKTKVKGAYGKGIRAASIRQLYDPIAGNRDLKHERSESYEASIEQDINKFKFELTYFNNYINDLIEWNDTPTPPRYINIGKAWTKGIETELSGRDILNSLDIRLGYTYLETKDEERNKPLRYRPTNYFSSDIRYKGSDKLAIDINAEIAGDTYNPYTFMKDTDGNNLPERVPPYKLVNIAASYQITHPLFKNAELQAKINNLFNENYREIGGFHTLGTNFLAGIEVEF
jgi:vitamin B12 transporter